MPKFYSSILFTSPPQRGYRISRKNLLTILRNNSILVRKHKKYAITTDSHHWMKKYPNLIRILTDPTYFELAYITYIKVSGEFAIYRLPTMPIHIKYLSIAQNRTLESQGAIMAFQMAIDATPKNKRIELIHHSDRVFQYCCDDYVRNDKACQRINRFSVETKIYMVVLKANISALFTIMNER